MFCAFLLDWVILHRFTGLGLYPTPKVIQQKPLNAIDTRLVTSGKRYKKKRNIIHCYSVSSLQLLELAPSDTQDRDNFQVASKYTKFAKIGKR